MTSSFLTGFIKHPADIVISAGCEDLIQAYLSYFRYLFKYSPV